MKKWKTSKILISTILLSGTLAACSSGSKSVSSTTDTTKSTSAQTNTAPAKLDFGPFLDSKGQGALKLGVDSTSIKGKVGVIVNSLAFPYGAGEKKLAQDAQQKYFPNIQLFVADGQDNPSVQSNVIDDYISKGVDVIILDPDNSDALIPAVKRAQKAGVKVICMDRTVNTSVTSTIKADDVTEGKLAAESMAKALGGKGHVVEITGQPGGSNVRDRHNGFAKALKKYPDMKLTTVNATFNTAKGHSVMQDVLQRFPKGEIQGVFSQSDVITIGIAQAIKETNRDELKIVSIDGQQAGLDLVKNGQVYSTTVFAIPMPAALIAAAKVIAKEPIPNYIGLSEPTVTKENIDSYMNKTGF